MTVVEGRVIVEVLVDGIGVGIPGVDMVVEDVGDTVVVVDVVVVVVVGGRVGTDWQI